MQGMSEKYVKTCFLDVISSKNKQTNTVALGHTTGRQECTGWGRTANRVVGQLTTVLLVAKSIGHTDKTISHKCENKSISYHPIDEETCRVQRAGLDIQRAGPVGAPGGAAGRGWEGLRANRIVRPGKKGPSYPPRHR